MFMFTLTGPVWFASFPKPADLGEACGSIVMSPPYRPDISIILFVSLRIPGLPPIARDACTAFRMRRILSSTGAGRLLRRLKRTSGLRRRIRDLMPSTQHCCIASRMPGHCGLSTEAGMTISGCTRIASHRRQTMPPPHGQPRPNKSPLPTGVSFVISHHPLRLRPGGRARRWADLIRKRHIGAARSRGAVQNEDCSPLAQQRTKNSIKLDGKLARGTGIRWPMRGFKQKYYSRFSPQ